MGVRCGMLRETPKKRLASTWLHCIDETMRKERKKNG